MTTLPESSSSHPRPDSSEQEDGWFAFVLRVGWPVAHRWRMVATLTGLAFVAASVFMFTRKNSYKADAHYLLSSSSTSKTGLSSLMNSDMSALMGMKLGTSPDVSTIDNLLGTGILAESATRRFHLERDWELDSTRKIFWEDERKLWGRSFTAEVNEDDGVTLSFESHDSILSVEVVRFVGAWIDSSLRAFHQKQAKDNADFFLGRILTEDSLLDAAQKRLVEFQKLHKIVRPEEQLAQAVQMAGTLETSLQKLDLEIDLESAAGSQSSPLRRLQETRRKTSEILRGTTGQAGSGSRDAGFVYRNIPATLELATEYERLYREVQIHRKALLLMIEGREQMMVEFRKSVPLLILIDPPKVPMRKSAPKRSSIVLVLTFFAFSASSGLAYLLEELRRRGVTVSRLRTWARDGSW